MVARPDKRGVQMVERGVSAQISRRLALEYQQNESKDIGRTQIMQKDEYINATKLGLTHFIDPF